MRSVLAFLAAMAIIAGICALFAGGMVACFRLMQWLHVEDEPIAAVLVFVACLGVTVWAARFIATRRQKMGRG